MIPEQNSHCINWIKKMAKTTQRSIKALRRPKVVDQIVDGFSMREMPITDAYLDRLAEDMLKYYEDNPESLYIYEFLDSRRIHSTSFDRWKARYPNLQYIYSLVLQMLATRREKSAWNKGGAVTIFVKTQHLYDPKWDEINKYHAKLREPDSVQQKIDIIEIPSIPLAITPEKK